MSEYDDLTEAWVEYYKRQEVTGDVLLGKNANYKDQSLFWAFDRLDFLCKNEPDVAKRVILEILHRDPSEFVLDNLAAGPLETLLAKNGSLIIDWVECQAKNDKRFKDLLSGVWGNDIPKPVWDRVVKAAGQV